MTQSRVFLLSMLLATIAPPVTARSFSDGLVAELESPNPDALTAETISSEALTTENILSETSTFQVIAPEAPIPEFGVPEIATDNVTTNKITTREAVTSEFTTDKAVTGEIVTDEIVTDEITTTAAASALDSLPPESLTSENLTTNHSVIATSAPDTSHLAQVTEIEEEATIDETIANETIADQTIADQTITVEASTLNSLPPENLTPENLTPENLTANAAIVETSTPDTLQLAQLTETEIETLLQQVQRLEERQEQLEQEIEQLQQQLEAVQTDAIETAIEELEAEETAIATASPMGLDITAEVVNFDPRPSNLQDFAIIDDLSALQVGGQLATLDYERTQAIRYSAALRLENSPVDIGFDIISTASDAAASVTAPAGGELVATLSNPGVNERAQTASANSRLEQNITNIEVGYNFDIGTAADARVYGGLRFADIFEDTIVRYDGIDFTNTQITIDRDFTGIGLMLGAEANLHLGAGFSLFGQAGGGLMVGDTRLAYQEVDNNGLDVIATLQQPGQSRVVPITEVAAGINWSGPLGNNTRLDASFGYRLENWFNVTDIIRYSDSSGTGVINQESANLSSGGLFFGLGFEFDF